MAKIYKLAFVFMLFLAFYFHKCFNPSLKNVYRDWNHIILQNTTSLIDFQWFFFFLLFMYKCHFMSHKAKNFCALLRKSSSSIEKYGSYHLNTFTINSQTILSAWPDTSATNKGLSPSKKAVVSIMTVGDIYIYWLQKLCPCYYFMVSGIIKPPNRHPPYSKPKVFQK